MVGALEIGRVFPSNGPHSHFYLATTTSNFGKRTLPVDRAGEIESIDSAGKKLSFTNRRSGGRGSGVGFVPFRSWASPTILLYGSGCRQLNSAAVCTQPAIA